MKNNSHQSVYILLILLIVYSLHKNRMLIKIQLLIKAILFTIFEQYFRKINQLIDKSNHKFSNKKEVIIALQPHLDYEK